MQAWTEKTIADLGRVVTGKTPPTGDSQNWKGDELFISPKDLEKDALYITSTESRITERAIDKFANQVLPPRSVMFTSLSFGFGKMGITSRRSLTNQQINSIIVNDKHDYRFVYYLLRAYTPFIFAFNSGIDTPIVPKSVFEKVKVLCPPLETQRKIAGILSAYDDLIENNRRRIAILERMAEELYREWFVRMRFPGYQNTKFVKGVPEGWEVKKLADIATSQYGFTASGEQAEVGPRLLRITDIVPSVIDWNNVPYCKIDEANEGKYTLEEGDIVVARTGATVGFAKMILKRHPRSVFASYLVRIRVNNPIDAVFVGLSVERQFFKDFINMFVTGAAQPQANATTMLQFPILYPTTELIKRFTKQVAPLLNQRELLHIEASVAGRQRNYLLTRLLAGTLDVTDLCVRCSSTIDRSNSIGQELAHA